MEILQHLKENKLTLKKYSENFDVTVDNIKEILTTFFSNDEIYSTMTGNIQNQINDLKQLTKIKEIRKTISAILKSKEMKH